MKVSLFGVGLLAISSAIGFAQAVPAQPQAPAQRHAVTINERRAFQQHRIAQGVRTGRIAPRRARRLERREVSIARQEHHMRAAGRGHLNHRDRAVLNHRLNRTSRAIHRDNYRSRIQ